MAGKLQRRFTARPGYWFVPKVFGWGAVPVTWQGWALTFLLVALGAAIARLAQERGMLFLFLLLPLVLGFAWLAWAKTDGGWGWRWGLDD